MKTYKAILSPYYEQPDERLQDEYTVEAPDLWKAREMIADMIDETMYTCDRSAVCPPILMVAFDPNAEHVDIIYNIAEM